MDKYFLGIDFGACNLKAVALDRQNNQQRALTLSSSKGGKCYAANVIFYKENECLIGAAALKNGITEPHNLVTDIKRNLERRDWTTTIPALGHAITAKEAARDIFGEIRKIITGKKGDVEIHATLTTPVGFTAVQRGILRQAAKEAGLIVDSIISEPFAAVFATEEFEELEDGDELCTLIFDFGGSSLDVSITQAKIENGRLAVKELAAEGEKFGGLDIDRDIFDKVVRPMYTREIEDCIQHGISERKILQEISENKEELFAGDDDEVAFTLGGEDIILKKADVLALFEAERYRERVTKLLDSVLEELGEHGKKKEDINLLFPCGGTVNIPFFIDVLRDYFGKDMVEDYDPDDGLASSIQDNTAGRYIAVAAGASIYMQKMMGEDNVEIEDLIPFSIGYDDMGVFRECVKKHSAAMFETRAMQVGTSKTFEENHWHFSIYQSFSNEEGANIGGENGAVYMGEVKLDGSMYGEDKIYMKMSCERDGCIKMKFLERRPFIDEDGDTDYRLVTIETKYLTTGEDE